MDDDQRDLIEKHVVGRLALETVRAQLGLVLTQAALARGQIGVTPRQLLIELGYSDEEITKMMGAAADQPLPASSNKSGTAPKAMAPILDVGQPH